MTPFSFSHATESFGNSNSKWTTLKRIHDCAPGTIVEKSEAVTDFISRVALTHCISNSKVLDRDEQVQLAKKIINKTNEVYPFNAVKALNQTCTGLRNWEGLVNRLGDYESAKSILDSLMNIPCPAISASSESQSVNIRLNGKEQDLNDTKESRDDVPDTTDNIGNNDSLSSVDDQDDIKESQDITDSNEGWSVGKEESPRPTYFTKTEALQAAQAVEPAVPDAGHLQALQAGWIEFTSDTFSKEMISE